MGESASPYLRIVGNRAPEPRDTSSEGASGASPDVVFITDAEGTVLYVNRSLPDVHQDDVLGTSFYDYILPEHHFAVRAANERVFGTGEPGGYEILGMTGHSSESWYDCRVVPTMRGGRVVSATVIARDVTLRKRIEENLRRELEDTKRLLAGVHDDLHRASAVESPGSAASPAQMALFREIIDRAGEAMFVVDPVNGQILDANGTACRWVSHRLEDLVTQKEADLRLRFPLRVPESYGDHVTDTRDLARPQIFRGEHRRTDGSSFPVEVAITRHIVGGRAFVLSVARDSKSRQQLEQALFEAEDKYRALFELSQDAIYISNRDGSIAEVNDAAAEMFHFTKDEFRGFPAKKLYTNSDDIRTFQREVATHGYVRDVEVAFTKKDGTSFRGLLTATLRHAGDRNVLGYQCVIRRSMERTSPLAPPTRHALEEAEEKGHGTVLLVEDNPRDRDEARRVLAMAGVRVLFAESLAEALIIFRARGREIGAMLVGASPADIVSDHAFAEIRRVAPHTRFVLMSSEDQDERAVVEHLATANLTGIVRKPFHPLALMQRIREAVELGRVSGAQPRPRPSTPRTSRAVTPVDGVPAFDPTPPTPA